MLTNPRQIETVLVEGSIGLKANAFTSEQIMKPNEFSATNPGTGQSEIRQTDIYPYIAWKNQEIVFADERLETIMEKLARWYDVAVFFQNESLKELRFDCNMRRYADINDLFFFMEKTSRSPVYIERENGCGEQKISDEELSLFITYC